MAARKLIKTRLPELGVPVVYADISQFSAICEVAYSEVGYRLELSYGNHMFQDLVEADVYYGAINENSKTRIYNPKQSFWKNAGISIRNFGRTTEDSRRLSKFMTLLSMLLS